MTKKLFNRMQTTCETCLPTCLMTMLDTKAIRVKKNEEMNILIDGLKMTRLDYTVGQLAYLVNNYGVGIDAVIEYPAFYKQLSKLRHPTKLRLMSKKIDKRLIEDTLEHTLPIVYLDRFYIGGDYHYPHFVVVTSLNNNETVLFDPWIGSKIKVETKKFVRAIQSLRNYLKLSPKLIVVH